MSVDETYYPATERVDWDPLHKHLASPWMFMMADSDGRFYYKHSDTREYLILDADGEIAT